MLTSEQRAAAAVPGTPAGPSAVPGPAPKRRHGNRARGIYAHYKLKYHKMREAMHRWQVTDGQSTSYVSFGRRYSASAPEISMAPFDDAEDSCMHCDDHDDQLSSSSSCAEEVNNNSATHALRHCNWRHPPRRNLIDELIDVDRLDAFVNLKGLQIRGGSPSEAESTAAALRLSRIGDEIVEQLVDWTKVLPFYNELPVEVHTHLLTQRWSELVLLSACYYATCGLPSSTSIRPSTTDPAINASLFQSRLSKVMKRPVLLEHVEQEAGPLIRQFTDLLSAFSKLRITLEAYVCLKSIALVHYAPPSKDDKALHLYLLYARKVQIIQDQFVKALQIHLSQCENGPRLSDLLGFLPLLTTSASTLLASKMFYVPFLICREPSPYIGPPAEAKIRTPEGSDKVLEADCTSSSISDVDEALTVHSQTA